MSGVAADWRYLVLDLWVASGREEVEFESFTDEHGDALVWSLLLSEVRDAPRCWEPLDGDDWCVLTEGHQGPHYGAEDVAAPVFLPRPTKSSAGRVTSPSRPGYSGGTDADRAGATACACPLNDDRACVSGRVYGRCQNDLCNGVCEYEDDCPCALHSTDRNHEGPDPYGPPGVLG